MTEKEKIKQLCKAKTKCKRLFVFVFENLSILLHIIGFDFVKLCGNLLYICSVFQLGKCRNKPST